MTGRLEHHLLYAAIAAAKELCNTFPDGNGLVVCIDVHDPHGNSLGTSSCGLCNEPETKA